MANGGGGATALSENWILNITANIEDASTKLTTLTERLSALRAEAAQGINVAFNVQGAGQRGPIEATMGLVPHPASPTGYAYTPGTPGTRGAAFAPRSVVEEFFGASGIARQFGGPVPASPSGPSSGDVVPAMLEPGEYVLSRQHVQSLGGIGAAMQMFPPGPQGGVGLQGGGTPWQDPRGMWHHPITQRFISQLQATEMLEAATPTPIPSRRGMARGIAVGEVREAIAEAATSLLGEVIWPQAARAARQAIRDVPGGIRLPWQDPSGAWFDPVSGRVISARQAQEMLATWQTAAAQGGVTAGGIEFPRAPLTREAGTFEAIQSIMRGEVGVGRFVSALGARQAPYEMATRRAQEIVAEVERESREFAGSVLDETVTKPIATFFTEAQRELASFQPYSVSKNLLDETMPRILTQAEQEIARMAPMVTENLVMRPMATITTATTRAVEERYAAEQLRYFQPILAEMYPARPQVTVGPAFATVGREFRGPVGAFGPGILGGESFPPREAMRERVTQMQRELRHQSEFERQTILTTEAFNRQGDAISRTTNILRVYGQYAQTEAGERVWQETRRTTDTIVEADEKMTGFGATLMRTAGYALRWIIVWQTWQAVVGTTTETLQRLVRLQEDAARLGFITGDYAGAAARIEQFTAMGARMGFAPDIAAGLAPMVAQIGGAPELQVQRAQAAMQMAVITGMQPQAALAEMTRIQQGFGLGPGQQQRILDVVAGVYGTTFTPSVIEATQAISGGAGIAELAGLSMEEWAGIAARTAQLTGRSSQETVNLIAQIQRRMAMPSVQETLGALGVGTVGPTGVPGSFVEILNQLSQVALTPEQQREVAQELGFRRISELQVILRHWHEINAAAQQHNEFVGRGAELYNAIESSIGRQLSMLGAQAQVMFNVMAGGVPEPTTRPTGLAGVVAGARGELENAAQMMAWINEQRRAGMETIPEDYWGRGAIGASTGAIAGVARVGIGIGGLTAALLTGAWRFLFGTPDDPNAINRPNAMPGTGNMTPEQLRSFIAGGGVAGQAAVQREVERQELLIRAGRLAPFQTRQEYERIIGRTREIEDIFRAAGRPVEQENIAPYIRKTAELLEPVAVNTDAMREAMREVAENTRRPGLYGIPADIAQQLLPSLMAAYQRGNLDFARGFGTPEDLIDRVGKMRTVPAVRWAAASQEDQQVGSVIATAARDLNEAAKRLERVAGPGAVDIININLEGQRAAQVVKDRLSDEYSEIMRGGGSGSAGDATIPVLTP